MAHVAQHWSISALSVELKMDRRTVGKYLAGVKPVAAQGKSDLYVMADVVRAILVVKTGTGDPANEKARLDRLRADQVEFDLNIKRKNYAPIKLLTYALADFAVQGAALLDTLPKRLKSSAPFLRAREIKIIAKELTRFRNAMANIRVRLDTDEAERSFTA